MAYWDWMTGRERLWWRIYRLRLVPGLMISLPFWFIIAWYLLFAWANHAGYNKATGSKQEFNLELFHLRVHDLFSRDWRRVSLPDADKDSALPTYQLFLSNKALDLLDADGPPEEGKGKYQEGLIKKDKTFVKARFRYRGKKHWNWNYAQKSWKVRMEEDLLKGQRTLSFMNPVSPLPFSEELILDVARENGLLTPDYFPVRLFLNRAFMGIYYWMGQPDEWLLRRGQRIPGSVYSGNGAPVDEVRGVSSLWWHADSWKKPAARLAAEADEKVELEGLLSVLQQADDAVFQAYVAEHLDLDKFALFDALDVIFGGNQHDYDQDHKLLFDPYRGRWEPIAWDFRGFEHRRYVRRSENPLQLRLQELPGYLDRRNHFVWTLIHGSCHPQEMERKIRELAQNRRADFLADPYWDAYGQLPDISKYFRQMVRPMNEERFDQYLEALLGTYRTRIEFLKKELSQASVEATLGGTGNRRLQLAVDGWDGLDLLRVNVMWEGGDSGWAVAADWNGDGSLAQSEPKWSRGVGIDAVLTPGTVLIPRAEPSVARGKVRLIPERRLYDFWLVGRDGFAVQQVTVGLRNRVTGQEFDVMITAPSAQDSAGGCVDKGQWGGALTEPGRRSLHPWCAPQAASSAVVLGPGDVEVSESRVFGEDQRVEVKAGTTLKMAPGASLFFFGPVHMEGTQDAPVVVQELVPGKPFGGVALQGAGTAGSVLQHVVVKGGTVPHRLPTRFGGVLNIQDSRNVTLKGCRIEGNSGEYDALHVAYVTGLSMEGMRFERVASDAADLEFVEGVIEDMQVTEAGDECLDLMGAHLQVHDVRFVGCGGAGVSAGEETRLRLERALIVGTATGILAKNDSRVRASEVVVDRAGVGVRIEGKEDRYEGLSKVRGRGLWLLRCRELTHDKKERLDWQSGGSDWPIALPEFFRGLGLDAGSPGQLWHSLDGVWTGEAPVWRKVKAEFDEENTAVAEGDDE